MGGDPRASLGPLAKTPGLEGVAPGLKLQILTTEHWSLLSTRALSWDEAFARAGMFLSAVTGAVFALSLVARVTRFGSEFVVFALLVLPVILFIGVATFRRLIEINREDVRWVIGMNRLRHAYLEAAPELRPYFVAGTSDDEPGIMTTFGATVGRGGFLHEFVTTPGLIAVINGVVAGALAAVATFAVGLSTGAAIPVALGAGIATVAALSSAHYRLVLVPRRRLEPTFPGIQAGSSVTNR
jgi:hypothetical protein